MVDDNSAQYVPLRLMEVLMIFLAASFRVLLSWRLGNCTVLECKIRSPTTLPREGLIQPVSGGQAGGVYQGEVCREAKCHWSPPHQWPQQVDLRAE